MSTQGKTTTKVVIVDPGMMAASGHHAGFASFLAVTRPTDSSVRIVCACHYELDSTLKEDLLEAGYEVSHDFYCNFYEIFESASNIADVQPFIHALAIEYAGVLRRSRAASSEDRLIYFYPSMAWEHAYALNLAMHLAGPLAGSEHVVCAMFSPRRAEINYRLAFGALTRLDNVFVYASDRELADSYGQLLDIERMPIHPCFLADWLQLPREVIFRSAIQEPRIILYMGDAKPDKGFCDLPSLVEKLLEDKTLAIQLYVQYTHLWESEEIDKAELHLKALADKDDRLLLKPGYLTDQELHNVLRDSDLFVFTYHERPYKQKSSGLLWLVAWYGLPLVFLHNTWLNREAARLSLNLTLSTELLKNGQQLLDSIKDRRVAPAKLNGYGQRLFTGFWPWLLRQSNE